LVLNLEKTNIKSKQIICHIVKNNFPHYALRISYKEKYMEDTLNQFLSIDSWIWNKPMSVADNTHMQEMTQQNTLILPVPCHMFSLTNFIVNNPDNFQTNPSVHNINITRKYNPHRPNTNLSCFQKSAFYAAIIIFNTFLLPLTGLTDKSTVSSSIKKILKYTHFILLMNVLCLRMIHNVAYLLCLYLNNSVCFASFL
jgi:hypothetical protein